ncbi:MAG: DUF5060 domain-containing protein [Bacteroidota bacterium]
MKLFTEPAALLRAITFCALCFFIAQATHSQAVTSFTLVNADTDSDIQQLADGATLNLQDLPTGNLNVRANVSGSLGSVRFLLNGRTFRVENVAPYALRGDRNGDYYAWEPSAGTYIIEAIPFENKAASGTQGTPLSITIVFTDEQAEIPVTDISIVNCPSSPMLLNDVVDLNVAVAPANATNKMVSFSTSSGPGLDNNTGVFTAAQVGSYTILATSQSNGNISDQCLITVQPNDPATSIDPYSIVQAEDYDGQEGIVLEDGGNRVLFIQAGNFIQFQNVDFDRGPARGTIRASSTTGGTLEFRLGSASGPLIASSTITTSAEPADFPIEVINPQDYTNGTTALGVQALYVVYSGGQSASCLVSVDHFQFEQDDLPMEIPVTDIAFINCPTEALQVGDQIDFEVSIFPDDATDPSVVFAASGDATIDANSGLFVAADPGQITITATSVSNGEISEECPVQVEAPPLGISVVSFTLVNASTNQDIITLESGATLNLFELPSSLNVRANTNPPTVGSVGFAYNGNTNYSTENIAPYAMEGDTDGNYASWTPTLGSNTIVATPYTGMNRGGQQGTSRSVSFVVINEDNGNPDPGGGGEDCPDYAEQDGIVVIEAENISPPSPWTLVNDSKATGGKYLSWGGGNNYGSPNGGEVSVELKITKTGTYRFMWLMRQPDGVASDLSNDSWVNFPDATHMNQNGVPYNGFIKVFGNGKGEFRWAATADVNHQKSPLFVRFDQPGTYTLQLAGRSENHQIDRIVLFHSDVAQNTATNKALNETTDCDDDGDPDPPTPGPPAKITGELKKWHKVTLSFEGPSTSETAGTNPFTQYRLNVTFTNGSKTYVVPGYYAADGQAANTSAASGNVWQANFSPDETGTWTYTASFRAGSDIAISTNPSAGSPTGFDGETGTFDIAASDKTGRDFRNTGRLEYVGEHYLQFAESGDYFFKVGPDAPENTFAYEDFDSTPNKSGRRKSWNPHSSDFNLADAGDYTWGAELSDGARAKGRELLGAVRYLSQQTMNAFSFLTFSLDGDDDNVYPHLAKVANATNWNDVHHDRFDVSKLAQWERIMEYADKKGMYLHFKTQETENDQKMDGGQLGRERKLYYRELIARFGHHLALNWNLGEENDIWQELNDPNNNIVKSYAQYIHDVDPYHHHIVIHTYPGQQDQVYDDLLGNNSQLTGPSIQTGVNSVHNAVQKWVRESAEAGKKWVVANDEQGGANSGVSVDASYPTNQLPEPRNVSDNRTDVRKKVLWGTLMAGGAGVEYYYGYQTGCDDLDCQDHRTRASKWQDGAKAIQFFNSYLQPYATSLVSSNGLTASNSDYVLANPGQVYVVYLPNGGSTTLNLSGQSGQYSVRWFDPRNGGALQEGTISSLTASGSPSIGSPPSSTNQDWVALIINTSNAATQGIAITNLLDTKAPVTAYPNPVIDWLNLRIPNAEGAHIEVSNIQGQTLINTDLTQGQFKIDMRDLMDGMYFLQVQHGNQVDQVKILKD